MPTATQEWSCRRVGSQWLVETSGPVQSRREEEREAYLVKADVGYGGRGQRDGNGGRHVCRASSVAGAGAGALFVVFYCARWPAPTWVKMRAELEGSVKSLTGLGRRSRACKVIDAPRQAQWQLPSTRVGTY